MDTLKVDDKFIYSSYSPYKEVKRFWDSNIAKYEGFESIVIYGLGLGYHVFELLKRVDNKFNIYIFDFDEEVYGILKNEIDFRVLDNNKNIHLFIGYTQENLLEFKTKIDALSNFVLVESILKCMPVELENIQEALYNYKIGEKAIESFSSKIKECEEANSKLSCYSISDFIEQYRENSKPILLVASGPSLTLDVVEYIKKVREKIKVFCVSRSLRFLVDNGVIPDMTCLIDCQDIVQEHFEGLEKLQVPLAFLSSGNSKAVSSYLGPKYIFFNEKRASNSFVFTGKSVAIANLDIGIRCTSSFLVFVGQDLGYINNSSHSEGVKCSYDNLGKINFAIKKVKDINGEYIHTTRGYLLFKKNIEKLIEGAKNLKFYNLSNGAMIKGTKVVSFKDLDELI
ncbi:MAG: 6-hydroxymethylpterin diphosphokinase MptE-like protein [Clostridium sp.]